MNSEKDLINHLVLTMKFDRKDVRRSIKKFIEIGDMARLGGRIFLTNKTSCHIGSDMELQIVQLLGGGRVKLQFDLEHALNMKPAKTQHAEKNFAPASE